MKLLINYSNKAFRRSRKLNSATGMQRGGFDKVISYGRRDIAREFFTKNENILSQRRGNGYWLWKPYFIERSLRLLRPGDFLFYSDAGASFVASVEPLVEICLRTGQDIIPFELMQLEKHWTKRDAFILLGCDSPEYTARDSGKGRSPCGESQNSPRGLSASFSEWRKTSG
jgi:hypothetical protein